MTIEEKSTSIETHTHTAEIIVDETMVEGDTGCSSCQESVMVIPSASVTTDYWTVGPSVYIDECGQMQTGHTQKFVTQTITTLEHPSIQAVP
mmetsp:Transcript_39449/g.37901  ORF Transcript_39449/g.37901 Transcript_39449/m.37901 type:complete len:92 (+) Transcript_39449:1348-1623(+)